MTSSEGARPDSASAPVSVAASASASASVADLGLVDGLAQLTFLVHGALAEIAARQDLSMIQVRLLGVLRDREPAMRELGRLLGLDKSSVTGLVDRAQRRGLVVREASATDRRSYRVSATPAGRELAERVAAEFAERIDAFAAALTGDERRLLAGLATRVVAADAHRHGVDLRTGGS
ncbi:MarR family winged helix-turn-helix transcriptional regulator [Kitasatospora sp. NPDC090308]|uniref:MarR family winged helix-turn-helix transcriptional regulator n=1 Tax=Kitasatospora sp. NPDC090308 TaxID=3364082 RepID=UPI003806CE14